MRIYIAEQDESVIASWDALLQENRSSKRKNKREQSEQAEHAKHGKHVK